MLNDISYEVAYIFFYMQYYLPCDILKVLDFFSYCTTIHGSVDKLDARLSLLLGVRNGKL